LLLRANQLEAEPKVVWFTPEEMEVILSAKPKTKKGK
jgi:hypothetical protein